jgi:hypothetical protein
MKWRQKNDTTNQWHKKWILWKDKHDWQTFDSINIFTKLILPIHEHESAFHILLSSLISFYMFNAIPTKIPMAFITEIEK